MVVKPFVGRSAESFGEYLRLTPRPQWCRTCVRKIRFGASPHHAMWPTRRLGRVDQLTVPLSTFSMLTRAAPMNAGWTRPERQD
jgi:hypothetical protein